MLSSCPLALPRVSRLIENPQHNSWVQVIQSCDLKGRACLHLISGQESAPARPRAASAGAGGKGDSKGDMTGTSTAETCRSYASQQQHLEPLFPGQRGTWPPPNSAINSNSRGLPHSLCSFCTLSIDPGIVTGTAQPRTWRASMSGVDCVLCP